MNSNNFIEIKTNMEHVFFSLLPPTHPTTHTFFPPHKYLVVHCPAYSSVLDKVEDTELR